MSWPIPFLRIGSVSIECFIFDVFAPKLDHSCGEWRPNCHRT